MLDRRLVAGALTLAVLAAGLAAHAAAQEGKKDDKEAKKEKRSGTVVGTLTKKGDNFIEVKADGEEKARRYVPHWVGGTPAQGGGPDKKILKVIRELKEGSRVRLEWEFEERARGPRRGAEAAGPGKEVTTWRARRAGLRLDGPAGSKLG